MAVHVTSGQIRMAAPAAQQVGRIEVNKTSGPIVLLHKVIIGYFDNVGCPFRFSGSHGEL